MDGWIVGMICLCVQTRAVVTRSFILRTSRVPRMWLGLERSKVVTATKVIFIKRTGEENIDIDITTHHQQVSGSVVSMILVVCS